MMRIFHWIYFHLYAPLHDLYWRAQQRGQPPPPIPCPICGRPGHSSRYCPHRAALGMGKR